MKRILDSTADAIRRVIECAEDDIRLDTPMTAGLYESLLKLRDEAITSGIWLELDDEDSAE